MTLDLQPWSGPAGIGARFAAEKKANPAVKVIMRTYQLGLLKAVPGAPAAGPDAQADGQRIHRRRDPGVYLIDPLRFRR